MASTRTNATSDTDRADSNRVKKVCAIRRFEQLCAVAADPKFRGTIGIEISVKDGSFHPAKITLVEYDRDP